VPLEYEHLAATEVVSVNKNSSQLVIPPREEMEVLHRLAMRGNMRRINQHADHLVLLDQRYGSFAEKLRSLTKEYRSEAILEFVEQHWEHRE